VPPPPDPARPTWALNLRETGLWSGPTGGVLFSKVANGTTFRVLDSQSGRFRVFYPGDGARRQPGEVWVDAADLSPVSWPRWIRLRRPGSVVTLPSANGVPIATLKPGDYVEVVGDAPGNWAHVSYLGDGRGPAADGWLEAAVPGADATTRGLSIEVDTWSRSLWPSEASSAAGSEPSARAIKPLPPTSAIRTTRQEVPTSRMRDRG